MYDQRNLSSGICMDLFTTRHKVVHNGGSLNFKGLLFDKKTTYMAQILQSLSYKVIKCSIILPEFNTFRLFILIRGTSTIMDQTACCYNVTTSEIDLQTPYTHICRIKGCGGAGCPPTTNNFRKT